MANVVPLPSPATTTSPRKGLRVALWIVQALLAASFALSGLMKTTTPIAELATRMSFVPILGAGVTRFIGVAELAGALGLILPALTRVLPGLTALAATGLVTVMALAAGFHVLHGEWSFLPVNVVLGGLASFVAWGRFRAAPIAARGATAPSSAATA